jgi:hypothetical protein
VGGTKALDVIEAHIGSSPHADAVAVVRAGPLKALVHEHGATSSARSSEGPGKLCVRSQAPVSPAARRAVGDQVRPADRRLPESAS